MFDYLQPRDGPVVDGLESQEIVYAKNQPEYLPLRTLRGSGEMVPVISRFTLTDKQRQAVLSGADIFLELSTFGQPLQPIRMAISDGKLSVDWVRVCLLDQPAENVADSYVNAIKKGSDHLSRQMKDLGDRTFLKDVGIKE